MNKIKRILAYQVDLPLYEESYNWAEGKSVSVFDSTVVAVETEEGMIGYGECCPRVHSIYPPMLKAFVQACKSLRLT